MVIFIKKNHQKQHQFKNKEFVLMNQVTCFTFVANIYLDEIFILYKPKLNENENFKTKCIVLKKFPTDKVLVSVTYKY